MSQAEISRYADVPVSTSGGHADDTLTVEVQPIDGTTANVSVNAKLKVERMARLVPSGQL